MSLDDTFAGAAEAVAVDSVSVGDSSLFLALEELRRRFHALRFVWRPELAEQRLRGN